MLRDVIALWPAMTRGVRLVGVGRGERVATRGGSGGFASIVCRTAEARCDAGRRCEYVVIVAGFFCDEIHAVDIF